MNRNSIILKGTCYFLLLVICQQFSCAAFCAIGAHSCGGEKQIIHTRSCCSHKSSRSNDKDNCQKQHMVFFAALGQSSVEKDLKTPDVNDNLVLMGQSYRFISLVLSDVLISSISQFKPPPLQADVRTFICSFQI